MNQAATRSSVCHRAGNTLVFVTIDKGCGLTQSLGVQVDHLSAHNGRDIWQRYKPPSPSRSTSTLPLESPSRISNQATILPNDYHHNYQSIVRIQSLSEQQKKALSHTHLKPNKLLSQRPPSRRQCALIRSQQATRVCGSRCLAAAAATALLRPVRAGLQIDLLRRDAGATDEKK